MEDIDFSERSGRLIARQGKGNKARTVPLNGSARQALAEYMAARLGCDPSIKAVSAHWPRPNPKAQPTSLWKSQKGGALTTSAMRQMIDEVVRAAAARGLVPPKTSAHTLRHTFSRNYLAHIPQFGWTRTGNFARMLAITSRRLLHGSMLRLRPLESFGDYGRSVSGNPGWPRGSVACSYHFVFGP